MEKTIKLTPEEGKVILDKRTHKTYKEVVCAEKDRKFFVEVEVE